MKLISHRGNLTGKTECIENTTDYIDIAIHKGYDVEIDVWYIDNKLYLGHDKPTYIIDINWLFDRITKLWIHCKNIESLLFFNEYEHEFNYFYHQNDDVVLTNMNYFWTYPGKKLTNKSIAVLPEITNYSNIELLSCYGICSDFINNYT